MRALILRPMTADTRSARYSLGEEIANSVTHGVGGLLAIGGLAVLTTFAALEGNAWHVVACSVYGATMVLLYACSTLYHSIQHPRAKAGFPGFGEGVLPVGPNQDDPTHRNGGSHARKGAALKD